MRLWVERGYRRIHLIGATASDVRNVMVLGDSGLLSCFPPEQRPIYEPSKHLITFHTGAVAETFSADEPERLRGPQCEAFWADELAAWRFGQDAWDNLIFGFRIGADPRGVISTTPKPIPLVKELLKDPHTVVTRGSSYENRAFLASAFFDSIVRKYEGTRIGRQELLAEILEDVEGALWHRAMIDAHRIRLEEVRWDLVVRIVVAIDPAVTASEDSDETGIIAAALVRSGHILILDDESCRESPAGWAKRAVDLYYKRGADRLIGEVNNGGDLVERNIRTAPGAQNISYRSVRASRGKMIRAEPVAAMYERGLVHHVGTFGRLEEQMCEWVPGMSSPDRMDALVWAITELAGMDAEAERYVVVNPPRLISSI